MARREKAVQQAAVIATHHGRVCLITSSSGKRWLLPKGHLEEGHKLEQTALQEAWEEAGLLGSVKRSPVGQYRYKKLGRTHHVVVFRMKVTQVRNNWPERKYRRRRWLRPAEAIDRIEDARLRKILTAVVGRGRAA